MAEAIVVFCDIEKYSTRSVLDQKQFCEQLSRRARTFLSRRRKYFALPTGDGFAVVFLVASSKRRFSLALDFTRRLAQWQATSKACRMRIGIHSGSVEYVTDINGRSNVCGNVINEAQRIMDAANPNQILGSERFLRDYLGQDSNHRALWDGNFHSITAKHGIELKVGSMRFEKNADTSEPAGAKKVLVSWGTLSRDPGILKERMRTSTKVALVHLSERPLHDAMSKKLDQWISKALTEFYLFMPDPKIYGNPGSKFKNLIEFAGHEGERLYLQQNFSRWKKLLARIKKTRPKARVFMGAMKNPPYFGACYFDWDKEGGTIHVGSFIWDVPAEKCPAFTIEWVKGCKEPDFFARYRAGFEGQKRRLTRDQRIVEVCNARAHRPNQPTRADALSAAH